MKIDAALLDQLVRFRERTHRLDPAHEVKPRQNVGIFKNLGAWQARDMPGTSEARQSAEHRRRA